ncbi:peptidoglycan DD-metalloendopeptidase family protein [Candidatus Gracilibacteria bacterium]|nr:peptidoglycan DD-metalloendopeptidase family protein [Candidatus Gracilibacteria bacterium]
MNILYYHRYRIIGTMLAILVPLGSWAIDRSTAGRILDDFKDRQEEILFQTIPFTETGANDLLIHEYTMNGLEALRSRLELVESGYNLKKNLMSEKRLSLEDALRNLDNAIAESEKSIQANTDTERFKSKYLQKLQEQSVELKRKIAEYRRVILEYIASVYSDGNNIYNENGTIDILQLLILSEGTTDLIITDMTYKTLVTELGQKFVTEYRSTLKDSYVLSNQIKEEILELQILRDQLEAKSRLIIIQKNEREKLLLVTKGQEKLFEEYLEAQKNAQKSVEIAWIESAQNYNNTMQATLKKYGCGDEKITEKSAKACYNARLYFTNEKKLQRSSLVSGTQNVLSWPVQSREVSTYFRDVGYHRLFGSQHDAIDIASPQGSDVVSSASGYVYYVLPPTEGGYSYLAIKHPDGFVTVYGHLSEILVRENQFVEGGMVIAKSGGLPGTPGAGPMTTGPHLHYEVWKDKASVDPLRYLSLSDVDYEDLPSLYEDKFIADIVETGGESVDVEKYNKKFIIRGKTEKLRQQFLLSKYATPDFQSWDMWIDAGINAQVDPSFLMCVGLAETTLGNHLKTSYNIGNIGNTDSGSTYSFDSPMEGVEWMAKTLNNKFLKKYTKLSELSRWGNEDGSIYASSSGNWHNNMVRCISALKGRFIENDFEFRLVN